MSLHLINSARLAESPYKQMSNLGIHISHEQVTRIVSDVFTDPEISEDYDGIKKKNGDIFKKFKEMGIEGFALTRTQMLDLISKALGFENHHSMKTSHEKASNQICKEGQKLPSKLVISDMVGDGSVMVMALYQPIWDDAETLIIGPHAAEVFCNPRFQRGSELQKLPSFRNVTFFSINRDLDVSVSKLQQLVRTHNRIIIDFAFFIKEIKPSVFEMLINEIKNKQFIITIGRKDKMDDWRIPKTTASVFEFKDVLCRALLNKNISVDSIDFWRRNAWPMVEFYKIEDKNI